MEDIAGVVLTFAVLGYPWKWDKFRGGDVVQWIGYDVDLSGHALGISEKRAKWLIDWVAATVQEGRTEVSDLAAVLGRFLLLQWDPLII